MPFGPSLSIDITFLLSLWVTEHLSMILGILGYMTGYTLGSTDPGIHV